MAYVDHPDRSRGLGFRNYADDTPRFEPDPASADDRPADEASPFQREAPLSYAEDEPAAPSALSSAKLSLAGFLVAAMAAAVLAYVGTTLVRSPRHPAPAPRLAPAAAAMAQAPAPGVAAAPPPVVSSASATAKPRRAAPPATTRRLLAPLDCAAPASPGQRMVCGSPRLLAQDRRLGRAYAEARADGAPPQRLRRDQARWLRAREVAARHSRLAVERLYRRRIAALETRPYGACAGTVRRATAADDPGGPSILESVTRWLLAAPRKIVAPRPARPGCG